MGTTTQQPAAPSETSASILNFGLPGNRRATVRRIALLAVAGLLAYFSARLHAITRIRQNNIVDPWADDLFPLAPSEPWDISTEFPYPRRISFEVDEGTWLRLDVHPVSGEIVFDMIGDIYCLPPAGGEARPVIWGTPFDAEPRFSPEDDRLLFRSDAGKGVSNLYALRWTSCADMAVRPSSQAPHTVRPELMEALRQQDHDEDLLASGVPETDARRRHRLMREGRLRAVPVTNETLRRLGSGRFHPSGTHILGTKWYDFTAEPWDWPVPSAEELDRPASSSSIGPGQRLLDRTLPRFWQPSSYDKQHLGLEMPIWVSDDEIVYSFDQGDYDTKGSDFSYNKDVHKGIYSLYIANVTTGEKRLLVSHQPGGATRPEISRDGRTLAFVRRVRDKQALVLIDMTTGTLRNIWYGLSYDTQVMFSPQGTYPSFAFAPDDSSIVVWAAGKIWRVPLTVLPNGERAAAAAQPHIIPFNAHVEKRVAEHITNDKNLVLTETAPTQRVHSFRGLRLDQRASRALVADHANSYLVHLKGSGPHITRIPSLHPEKPYYSPNFVPDSASVLHVRWSDTEFSALELVDMDTLSVRELAGVPPGRIYAPAVSSAGSDPDPALRKIAWIRGGGDELTGTIAHTLNTGLYVATLDLSSAQVSFVRLVSRDVDAARETKLRFVDGGRFVVVEHDKGAYAIDLLEHDATVSLAKGNYTREVAVALRMENSMMGRLFGTSKLPSVSASAFIDFSHLYVTRMKNAPLFSGARGAGAPKDLLQVSATGGHDLVWSDDGQELFWLTGHEVRHIDVNNLMSKCGKSATLSSANCAENLIQRIVLNVEFETDVARMRREAQQAAGVRGKSAAGVWIVNATLVTMKTGSEDQDVVPEAAILLRDGVIQRLMHMRSWKQEFASTESTGAYYDWDITYMIDGMNTIEHNLPFEVVYEDVKQLMLQTGVANTPVHLVNYVGTLGEELVWGPSIENDDKLRRFLPHRILEGIEETTLRPDDSWQLCNVSAYLADLTQRGLHVLIGGHGEPPIGLAYHAEMESAQAGGLSNYETFRAATRSAALVYGLFNSIGSIEPGKLADLVVYPPGVDVLKDIRLSRQLKYVIRGGRIWEADDLTEVWPVKGREYLSSLPPLSAD